MSPVKYAAYILTLDSLTSAAADSTIKSKTLKGVLTGVRKFTDLSIDISVTRDSLFLPIVNGTTNVLFKPKSFTAYHVRATTVSDLHYGLTNPAAFMVGVRPPEGDCGWFDHVYPQSVVRQKQDTCLETVAGDVVNVRTLHSTFNLTTTRSAAGHGIKPNVWVTWANTHLIETSREWTRTTAGRVASANPDRTSMHLKVDGISMNTVSQWTG